MNDILIQYREGNAIPRAWTLEMILSEIKRLDKKQACEGRTFHVSSIQSFTMLWADFGEGLMELQKKI